MPGAEYAFFPIQLLAAAQDALPKLSVQYSVGCALCMQPLST